jgi:hypothetical protein
MYSLSIVMAAGLFPVCFDIGAQAERVNTWGWGQTIPIDASPDVILQSLQSSAESVSGQTPPTPPPSGAYPDLLDSYYGFTDDEQRRLRLGTHAQDGPALASPHSGPRNAHARLH